MTNSWWFRVGALKCILETRAKKNGKQQKSEIVAVHRAIRSKLGGKYLILPNLNPKGQREP